MISSRFRGRNGSRDRRTTASFSRTFGTLAPAGTGKWLLIDAAIAGGYGMSDHDILKSVTLNPAEMLGVGDRVGSLAPGKDADVIILDGHPLSVKTWVEGVYVNGELVYQRETPP
ncbi:MAG: amidohydrolase family protein [Gemmatimonadetes bacterium]|nr:amidohydrolase family protein [Gemmatimonadota bacterium]